jgi:DNA replication initiation complex subunit (GINS family)
MRVFINRNVLVLASVLMLGFAGCGPGQAMSTLEGYVQSAKAALPGASPVRLSPEEQELFDQMSPEQQASFYRVLRAFREVKAEQAAAIERGTKKDIQTHYADSTEEVFRKLLLKDPKNTLGDR